MSYTQLGAFLFSFFHVHESMMIVLFLFYHYANDNYLGLINISQMP